MSRSLTSKWWRSLASPSVETPCSSCDSLYWTCCSSLSEFGYVVNPIVAPKLGAPIWGSHPLPHWTVLKLPRHLLKWAKFCPPLGVEKLRSFQLSPLIPWFCPWIPVIGSRSAIRPCYPPFPLYLIPGSASVYCWVCPWKNFETGQYFDEVMKLRILVAWTSGI